MPLAAWRYQNPFVYKHQETSQNFFGKKEHKITSSKLVPTYLFCTHFIFIVILLVCFILGLLLKRIEFFLFPRPHTYAKLIEIKLLYLQKRHGLHESVGKMESNDTPHGSQFGSLLLWKFSPKFATFLKQKDYLAIFLETYHLSHLHFCNFICCNYFLTPWGSLGTDLSSQGTTGHHFLTQKQFQLLSFNLSNNINHFLMTQNQFHFFARLIVQNLESVGC